VPQALDTIVTVMKRCARDMRKLSSDHQIRDFGPIHVHYGVLSNARFKYDQIVEKLEIVSDELLEAGAGESPLHEVQASTSRLEVMCMYVLLCVYVYVSMAGSDLDCYVLLGVLFSAVSYVSWNVY
jgi:hypothetical protein